MLTHDELIKKKMDDPAVRAEYERIEREEMPMLDTILKAGKHSPSIATLQKYAAALGKKLEVRFS